MLEGALNATLGEEIEWHGGRAYLELRFGQKGMPPEMTLLVNEKNVNFLLKLLGEAKERLAAAEDGK